MALYAGNQDDKFGIDGDLCIRRKTKGKERVVSLVFLLVLWCV